MRSRAVSTVADLSIRTLADAREAAHRAAALCPHAGWLEAALLELLVNAVEHGNLAVGHADKLRLRAAGRWEAEIERRLQLPVYADRRARITVTREPAAWCFEIADEGQGFDWRPWLELDDERAAAPCGRGIALARRLALADLTYLGAGNRVRGRVADA